MSERFTNLPMCFYVDDELMQADLRLNLFQVEGYIPSSVVFNDEDNIPVEAETTKVYTKSGYEYDILMPIAEFEKLIK